MRDVRLRNIIFAGLLVAIGIILNQFVSIYYPPSTTIIKFGIGFLPLILISIYIGPEIGVFSAIAFDLIGYLIWGVNTGPFHIGFTLNAVMYGVIPGLIFRIKTKWKNLFSVINLVFSSLLVISSIIILFNINGISSNIDFSITMRYIIVVISLISTLAIFIYVFIKRKEDDDTHRIIFLVLLIHLVVSLVMTPLWVSNLYHIPYWPQLPLRIAKLPVEVFIYVILLIQLHRVLKPRLLN